MKNYALHIFRSGRMRNYFLASNFHFILIFQKLPTLSNFVASGIGLLIASSIHYVLQINLRMDFELQTPTTEHYI